MNKAATTSANGQMNVNGANSLDYSKAEETIRNINIPESVFMAKWVKDKGYAIGLENIQITKYHKELDSALCEIGYGVEKDKDEDEILVKVGDVDYEIVVRIFKALMILQEDNKELTNINEQKNG